MARPAERLPTFEEMYTAIESLPEGLTGEVLGPGELRVMGRPGGPHRRSSRVLLQELHAEDVLFRGSGWWFEVEPEIRLGDRLFVPDLAGWRVEGEPTFVEENPIEVVPDWICEILSRSTQRVDRARKLPVYAEAGVGHAWVSDPLARTVEAYESREGRPWLVTTVCQGEPARLPPFDLHVDPDRLWR